MSQCEYVIKDDKGRVLGPCKAEAIYQFRGRCLCAFDTPLGARRPENRIDRKGKKGGQSA